MVYSSNFWHLTSGTPIMQCDAQHAKRSCIDNSHLMACLTLQLSFKFWSPIHHMGHLILVAKELRSTQLAVKTNFLQISK